MQYIAETLEKMDADTIEQKVRKTIGKVYVNRGDMAYQATYSLEVALSLFTLNPDVASFVRVYFNPLTKGGYVAVDIRGIVEFPFTQLGRDDALAVCRAFLYAYHNQEVSA